MTVFTIGHSTRSLDEFLGLLQRAGVNLVVDVRTVPRSRRNPQFNTDILPTALAPAGIGYRHIAALGGLRGRSRSPEPSPNGLWRNASFRNYADYAMTADFAAGLDALGGLARDSVPAIMCAEAVWWRCHRRIIADHLIARGVPVAHILGAGRTQPATLTPGAAIQAAGIVVYPADGNSR